LRTGPALAIRQGPAAGTSHGATALAVALSATLHGALAAGVFLWTAGPAPHAVGDPVVVELVAAIPGSDTASAAVSDDGPAADAAVPLGVPSGPDDEAPPPESAEAAEPPPLIETATSAEPPVPVFRRPPRRPTPPAARQSPPPSRTTTGSAMSPAADDGGLSVAGGADGESDEDLAAAMPVGPRFVLGSAGNPLPRYPLAARRRGLEGRVVVRVFVAADGRPASFSVHSGSTHPILDDAAIEALRRWRFEPARRAGVPVAAWVDVPITFRLTD